jgi:tetratricopeptide (TPR) repeat protein
VGRVTARFRTIPQLLRRTWVLVLLCSAALAGSVLAWHGVRQEREFRRLIALGDVSLSRDQTSLAIEAFSGAVALKPDSMVGYLKRGDTYRRRSDFAAALRDLRQAAAIDPMAPRPLELLGDVSAAMGQFERAAEEYRRFIGLDDRSPRVLYKLALAFYRNNQCAAAFEPLRQALAINERLAEAHYLVGLCLREQHRDHEAVAALRRAVGLNAGLAEARTELAEIYAATGRHHDAMEQLEAMAASDPSRPGRLADVALAYARLGRTETAVLTLGRAAERYPNDPAISAALGRIWLEAAAARNDRATLQKAFDVLQPAASRDSASGEALALYGRALFLSGDSAAAEQTLTKAGERLPVDPATFLYLAAAAERSGHADIARTAVARYAVLVPPAGREARSSVAELMALQRRLRFPRGGATGPRAERKLR